MSTLIYTIRAQRYNLLPAVCHEKQSDISTPLEVDIRSK